MQKQVKLKHHLLPQLHAPNVSRLLFLRPLLPLIVSNLIRECCRYVSFILRAITFIVQNQAVSELPQFHNEPIEFKDPIVQEMELTSCV